MDKCNIDFEAISNKVTNELISKVKSNDASSEIIKIMIDISVKSSIEVLKEYHKSINN